MGDEPILHLTTEAAWERARETGELRPPGFDDEGFVHCSTRAQVVGTILRHFPEAGELLLLELDPAAVAGDLRWEESRPGERFPHLYRPLRPADVVATHRWRRGADGSVALPASLAR